MQKPMPIMLGHRDTTDSTSLGQLKLHLELSAMTSRGTVAAPQLGWPRRFSLVASIVRCRDILAADLVIDSSIWIETAHYTRCGTPL